MLAYIPTPWILWDIMDGCEIRHQMATMGFQWNTVFIMVFFEGIDHLPIGDFATMHSRISIYTVSTNPMLNAYFPNSYNNLGYSLFLHTPRWPECLGWAEGICINHYKSMVFLLDGMLDEHMNIWIHVISRRREHMIFRAIFVRFQNLRQTHCPRKTSGNLT